MNRIADAGAPRHITPMVRVPVPALMAVLTVAACAHRGSVPAPGQPSPADSTPPAGAQTAPLRRAPAPSLAAVPAVDITASPFFTTNRADWPGPNQFRSASGAPGPAYWQQRADYAIAATLDTAAHTITGMVTVTYTNNSPDTLRFVWMQVDQNLYRQGSAGSRLYGGDTRSGGGGFAGGYDLTDVRVGGTPVTPDVHDTMMRLDLPSPVAPHGGKVSIAIHYAFRVPEHGSDRMGRDGTLYELAQWYPRMAVYDDVRGWNTDPYLGQGEFYLEYGDIDYAVTVPAGYIVAGSGVLQNSADVLSEAMRHRLAQAITSSTVVPIITKEEALAATAKSAAGGGTKTWRFRARNVRDVAWAGAPDFRWDATSVRGVLCQAYYQWPKAGAEWEQVAENTQWTIRMYSELLAPYPYPQATSVAGTVSGMEYPMFVMDGYANPDLAGDVFRTNDHEHGHEWFPMTVGSNERRYAWMDEGINTYINAFSQERRYGGDLAQWPRGMDNWHSFLGAWMGTLSMGVDEPLLAMPDHVMEAALGNVGYEKPAAVLLALRDHVVGREAMDAAMREYVRRWSFKHPTPGDFFRTVENVTGRDLSWFWREFFYTTAMLDIGVDSVENRVTQVAVAGSGPGEVTAAVVLLHRHSAVVFPVVMRLKFDDGSTQDVALPVDIWARGEGETYAARVPVAKRVTGVRLWPNRTALPDVDPRNDVWGDAPAGDPPAVATAGGLTSPVPAAGPATGVQP